MTVLSHVQLNCSLQTVLQIAGKQMDLKKKLKVTFAGEPGLDMGGLTKEWFLLLVRQIFQPEYGNLDYKQHISVFKLYFHHC